MTFRSKLLVACVPLALAPLAFFGLRVRDEVVGRLEAQYRERVAALADVVQADVAREAAAVGARLDRVAEAIKADNRLRRALLDGAHTDRTYVLDYAGHAMGLVGLDVLRIQDAEGRVLSSGHFRNEYDVVDAALPAAVARAGDSGALAAVRTPGGEVLALARVRELRLGPRVFTLLGGTAVDTAFLDRLARGTGLGVRLEAPAPHSVAEQTPSAAPAGSAYARAVTLRFAGAGPDTVARFVVHASLEPLAALRAQMDRWLLVAAAAAAALALALASVIAARLSRPLAELARHAARVDLDDPDASFATRRRDEIGALARVLDAMMQRLRASAARLREAERRATVGEIAWQVNHDVRNGLIPIRNVVAHLAELARERPDELPRVFLERQRTLDAGIEYLHSLAANYARLSPEPVRKPCDVNAVARAVASDAAARAMGASGARAVVATDLAPSVPPVLGDPVALRRILENLVVNALESLDDDGGRVLVATRVERGEDGPRVVIEVADTGRGMDEAQRARIFEDFYTTKPGGTGLGLSIVRRLVSDLGGRIEVESAVGQGTRFRIELPGGVSAGRE